jgi:hypothetical protein
MISLVPVFTSVGRLDKVISVGLCQFPQADCPMRLDSTEDGCSTNIKNVVRQYTAQRGITVAEALGQRMEESSKEFTEADVEFHVLA